MNMIIISFIAIMILLFNFISLETLLNPGFVSVYDRYLFRAAFVNDDYYVKYLERQHIRDGLFGELTTQIKGNSTTFDFNFAPFWVDMDRWLMAILLIAMILLVINRVLVLLKILPEYIADIPLYAMIILSICGYYLAVKVLGGYVPEKADFHVTVILLVIVSVFAIVWGIVKNKSVKEVNKTKKRMVFATIVVIVQALLFLILPGRFMIDAIKVSSDYKNTKLGSFDPEKMKVRYDLEENGFAGNFANRSVDTEEGLYFIENEASTYDIDYSNAKFFTEKTTGSYTYIRKLDKNGNITDICPANGDDKERLYNYVNIGYADGNIYASTAYTISRIDPKNGTEVEEITASANYYIAEMCVVDDKLYYMELPEDYRSSEDSFVWVCKIDGSDLLEPELFTADLDRGVFSRFNQFDSSSLLTNLVIGDYINDRRWQGARYQKCDGKSFYVAEGSEWNDKFEPTQLIVRDDLDPNFSCSIKKVGGFTIYNGSIYFIQLKENGLDVCKSNLDGTNIEVLDTYTCDRDLTNNKYQSIYRIMIGQGKIYVSAIGNIYPNDNGRADFGSIRFITDLK